MCIVCESIAQVGISALVNLHIAVAFRSGSDKIYKCMNIFYFSSAFTNGELEWKVPCNELLSEALGMDIVSISSSNEFP